MEESNHRPASAENADPERSGQVHAAHLLRLPIARKDKVSTSPGPYLIPSIRLVYAYPATDITGSYSLLSTD